MKTPAWRFGRFPWLLLSLLGGKTRASMALSLSLLALLCAALGAEPLRQGWTRQEAEAKLGTRVECLSNPDQTLLQWGPRFSGWDRSRQPKALGRPVKIGSKGVIKEVLPASKGKYQVVVHWEPESPGDPFWSTVIGPDEDNLTISSTPKSNLDGRWREVGRTATLEFQADGAFKAVDNEGLAVAGRYTVGKDGSIRFEIQREGATDEIVNLSFSINGDQLTLNASNGAGTERYQKEK